MVKLNTEWKKLHKNQLCIVCIFVVVLLGQLRQGDSDEMGMQPGWEKQERNT